MEANIKIELLRYLSGKATLESFNDWFVPATMNLHKSGDLAAADLAAEVELLLAEYTSGHRTEEDLRRELGRLAYTFDQRTLLTAGSATCSVGCQTVAFGITAEAVFA